MDEQKLINLFIGNAKLEGNKILLDDKLHDALYTAFNEYHFDVLKSITAVDKGDGRTELIYNLYSTVNEEDLIYSYITEKEADSVVDIFKSAQADENEIYDMFGINFIGNDNLERLYMPESWEGYPLRKDYVQNDTRLAWNDNNDI